MTPAMLRQLLALTEARKACALAQFDALLAEDRRLVAEIAEMGGVALRDMAEAAASTPFAQQALRQAWADQRRAQATRRRSALAGELQAARAAAARSLGKHEALARLVEAAERAARLARAARAEREAPPAEPQEPSR